MWILESLWPAKDLHSLGATNKVTKKSFLTVTICVLSAALLVFLDQWSKTVMQAKLLSEGPVIVIKDFLGFYYVENTGAAFNMLDKQRIIFLIIAVIVVVFGMIALIRSAKPKEKVSKGALLILRIFTVLILAGAVGNGIDRAVNGYVIDFIRVLFIEFPVFNLADCYVVVACIFLLVFVIFRKGLLEEMERSLGLHG